MAPSVDQNQLQPSSNTPKRPSLPHRQSAGGAVRFASHPSGDALSTSAQKRVQRNAGGQGRTTARIPSFNKTVNKSGKVQSAKLPDNKEVIGYTNASDDAKPKRNSSNLHLRRNNSSHIILRKNVSETSLKRNKWSSGQLTKLARPNSSRNMSKTSFAKTESGQRGRKKKTNSGKPSNEKAYVRFDVGSDDDDDVEDESDTETEEDEVQEDEVEDDSWTDDGGSRSASVTRSNTRRNSKIGTSRQISPDESEKTPPPQANVSSTVALSSNNATHPHTERTAVDLPHTPEPTVTPLRDARPTTPTSTKSASKVDNLPTRLFKRNVSFNTTPQISSVSTTSASGEIIPHNTTPRSNALNDASGSEIVSRFIEAGASSSNDTGTRDNSYNMKGSLSQKVGSDTGLDGRVSVNGTANSSPQSRRSSVGMKTALQMTQRTDSHHSPQPSAPPTPSVITSGQTTPSAILPSSRTQQRLWIERASTNLEDHQPQTHPPIGLLRSNRLITASTFPFAATARGEDGKLHPQMRQVYDRANAEYRRVRMFLDPCKEAAARAMEQQGQKGKIVSYGKVSHQDRTGKKPIAGGSDKIDVYGPEVREICKKLWSRPIIEGQD